MNTLRFADYVGNGRLVRLLKQGRFPPAALFTGPPGVGKKTLALLLAAWWNCRNRETADEPCGRCSSCLKAASGNHPDILLFQAETSALKIEAMRRLSREVQFRPFEGKLRFFVIDEAERLTEEAANSILKTLEEPPETSHLVLVTAFPLQLPATIRSRCQFFAFGPLSREQIQAYLGRQATVSEPELVAAFAGGSLGTALSLDLEQTLKDRDRMLALLADWLHTPSFSTVYEHCDRGPLRGEVRSRDRVLLLLKQLEMLVQDLYFLSLGSDHRLHNRDCREKLRELSGGRTLDWYSHFLYHIARARSDADRFLNAQMCFETLWLEAAVPPEYAGSNHRPLSKR